MRPQWQKNTAVFLVSQIISLLGSSLVQYAITWYITRTTQSGFYAMLSIVFGFLPTFFLSPFAGVWADRYNRKTLIIVADACIALCTLLLAIVFMFGMKNIWLLLIASGIRALGSAVQTPSVNAMLPDIVPQEHLTRVNGINQTAQSVLTLGSPMLAAVLLGLPVAEPLVPIFFVDVITAALAIGVMFFFFKLPAKEKAEMEPMQGGYFGEMMQGIRYILKQPFLRHFFIFCILFYLLVSPAAFLTQLQVSRSFGPEYWRLSTIEVTFSVGMVLGGILISTWQGLKNRMHTLVLAGISMGLCTVLLGIPINFVLYNVWMGLFGLIMPVFNTPAIVTLQERVDPSFMGRVFGVMSMLSSSIMPLGMLVYGPLADIIPIEWILVITGLALVAVSASMLRSKPLYEAGKPRISSTPEVQS